MEVKTDDAELLNLEDFARAAGKLSPWTVRKMAYTGRIASVKIGVRLLIPRSELQRLIDEGLRPRRGESA